MKEKAIQALASLTKAGADKASCRLSSSEKREFNLQSGKLTLLRTTFDTGLTLKAITGDRKGSASTNNLASASIEEAAERAVSLARSAEPDPANEIAEAQEPGAFGCGPEKPELDLMYDRLAGFIDYARKSYPNTILDLGHIDFTASRRWFVNSNGVDWFVRTGHYDFIVAFTTKVGSKSSSVNFAGFSADALDRPLERFVRTDALLKESTEQVETRSVPEKFVGDILVTPECLDAFLAFLTESLRDYPLITGSSLFKDKLGRQIASEALSLHARPLAPELITRYFVTQDGYRAEDSTIVDHGILKGFLLSLYGARRTGRERAVNDGDCYIVDAGATGYEEMLRSVERGVLVCRFSGGQPAWNGDFAGVAKNSYFVEGGRICFPLSETMISGNLAQMFLNIKGISRERVNFGSSLMPWVRFGGITVSGK